MSKLVRAAQTSQSLSLAAMEEASRLGLREADIEHLFLALVITDQSAGRALRGMGIDLEAARRAVEEQRQAHLESLGIEASFPSAGRIVFHETFGYEWSRRASDLLGRSGGKGKDGDAAAVLRELVAEPSGSIADLLERLGTTSGAVLDQLDRLDHADRSASSDDSGREAVPATVKIKGRVSGSTQTFVPAPIEEVWAFLADPTRVPEWEMSVGSIDDSGQDATPGTVWQGRAPETRPDGKPVKIKPRFRRRTVELVEAQRPERIVWRTTYPDSGLTRATSTEFALATATGGTQVTITLSWARRGGWRKLVAWPLRPFQKFLVWIVLFQTGSAISRPFR
ncbi:Clp protease N-terminal domain-containing protein [Herbiconiux sp. P15]|uniref:SRPBCC family protein n=1 Tax=Herbiconiux liukaitaii TaxID=3342799 RepID=UPI0035B94E9E